jgi:RNA 3'-terminal phosphate cyclase (ATP)
VFNLSVLSEMSCSSRKEDFLEIDGSLMEGGGQILRMSVGFSALLRRPIRIQKIRGHRSRPGLKAQHLNGMFLVRDVSEGSVLNGAKMDSSVIDFTPGTRLRGGDHFADTKTAGATTLLAQVSLPCLLFADAETNLNLRGGTDAIMAPPAEYYVRVFRANLNKFGADFGYDVVKKGYFPRGGGQLVLKVPPVKRLNPVTLTDMGEVTSVSITASVAGKLPVNISREMADAAKNALLKGGIKCEVKVDAFKEGNAAGNGSSILVVAETSTGCVLGGSAVGSPKEKPWVTGETAARELLDSIESRPCVDAHMQDQMVMPMALAAGKSRVRMGPLTMHTRTAIHICEMLSGAVFKVEKVEDNGGAVVVECEGIGMVNEDFKEASGNR